MKIKTKSPPQNVEIRKKLAAQKVPTPVVSPANLELAQQLYGKGLKSYLEGDLAGTIKYWEQALQADPTNFRVQNDLVRAKIEEKVNTHEPHFPSQRLINSLLNSIIWGNFFVTLEIPHLAFKKALSPKWVNLVCYGDN